VCLSYSARLVGSRWSALVCAAGTVFNQLIVWSASVNHQIRDSSGHAHSPVLHRLQQHKVAVMSRTVVMNM